MAMPQSNSSSFAGLPATQPLPQVLQELELQDVQLEVVSKSIAMLEDRLTSVLAHASTGQVEASGHPEPIRVPLADRIHSNTMRLDRMANALGDLFRRLEI